MAQYTTGSKICLVGAWEIRQINCYFHSVAMAAFPHGAPCSGSSGGYHVCSSEHGSHIVPLSRSYPVHDLVTLSVISVHSKVGGFNRVWAISVDVFVAMVAIGGLMVTIVGVCKAIIAIVRGIHSLFRKDIERVVQKDPTR